jgi:hypothetical protein
VLILRHNKDIVSKNIGRQKRGQVSTEEIEKFNEVSLEELRELLNSNDPQKRTIGATIIGKRKYVDLIPSLCCTLEKEKSLYPRIAISEALAEI